MAKLPDPRPGADASVLAEMQRMANVRSHAEGRAELGSVYVAMFNNPGVARYVGALGEHLRFAGTLPDRVRETVILRYAARRGLEYEWSHHVRPAQLAGLAPEIIARLAERPPPTGLEPVEHAAVQAVDHIVADQEIPATVQRTLTDAVGDAGVVELVALCGLYALMGYMTTAFAIDVEAGLPKLGK
jgi:4-carboxymuconolactone decarboxylase